jgi:hypothetical protein
MGMERTSSLQSGRRDLLGTLLGRAESIAQARGADRCDVICPPDRPPPALLLSSRRREDRRPGDAGARALLVVAQAPGTAEEELPSAAEKRKIAKGSAAGEDGFLSGAVGLERRSVNGPACAYRHKTCPNWNGCMFCLCSRRTEETLLKQDAWTNGVINLFWIFNACFLNLYNLFCLACTLASWGNAKGHCPKNLWDMQEKELKGGSSFPWRRMDQET